MTGLGLVKYLFTSFTIFLIIGNECCLVPILMLRFLFPLSAVFVDRERFLSEIQPTAKFRIQKESNRERLTFHSAE